MSERASTKGRETADDVGIRAIPARTDHRLRVLSLFAGIGGFDLGLERTGGFKTVAFCEIDPFCRRVLAKHWPEVPCYDDVRTLTAERLAADGIAVDVICGGFPCQDISNVGRRSGLAGGKSGLWTEMLRLIRDCGPELVIIENSSHGRRHWIERICRDLAELDFETVAMEIAAFDIGLPHERRRAWVLADTCRRRHRLAQEAIRARRASPEFRPRRPDQPGISGVAHGLPGAVDRRRALGNAVIPQIPELIGRAILADATPNPLSEGRERS